MVFRNLLLLDDETLACLKTLAASELRSPRNVVRWLIRREWEARRLTSTERIVDQPASGVSPSIPSSLHLRQGK